MHFQKVYAKVCGEKAAKFEQNARATSSLEMKRHYMKLAKHMKKCEEIALAHCVRMVADDAARVAIAA